MTDKCVELIEELIKARKEKGLTQRELSQLSNIKQSAIARLETKSHAPTLETLLKIADALEYKVELKPK